MSQVVPSADSARVHLPPPVVYLAAVSAGWAAARWFTPLSLPAGTAGAVFRWAGGALVAGGVTLAGWAVACFRLAGTTPVPTRPTTAIVDRGPFRLSRNPMYLGLTAITLGVGFVTGNLWITLAAIPAAIVIDRYAIAREERYLDRKFGDAYRAYRGVVRRWV